MVGLIATTLLAGARMPAGATSNMKRKIPRDAADRIAVAGPERDVRNLVPFLRMEKCFFLTSPFIEPLVADDAFFIRTCCHRGKNSRRDCCAGGRERPVLYWVAPARFSLFSTVIFLFTGASISFESKKFLVPRSDETGDEEGGGRNPYLLHRSPSGSRSAMPN